MSKVDRSKLYGFKEVKALNEADETCELATLAGDGCTLIGRGGTGLGWLDADGDWREKSELTPVDKDGEEIEPVPSSFSAPIQLFDTATVEQYLEHSIRLVYCVEPAAEAEDLMAELNRGTIFTFPYSYRGGLEADAGFLLANDEGEVMLAVGDPTDLEFIGMAAPAATVDENGEEGEADLMDFDMI
ncbi:MAG: hypothetical protein ACR2NZ_21710 [Rubripirellula sp.]